MNPCHKPNSEKELEMQLSAKALQEDIKVFADLDPSTTKEERKKGNTEKRKKGKKVMNSNFLI